MVAVNETIFSGKPGGFAPRRRLGGLCAFAVHNSVPSFISVARSVPAQASASDRRTIIDLPLRVALSKFLSGPRAIGRPPVVTKIIAAHDSAGDRCQKAA